MLEGGHYQNMFLHIDFAGHPCAEYGGIALMYAGLLNLYIFTRGVVTKSQNLPKGLFSYTPAILDLIWSSPNARKVMD